MACSSQGKFGRRTFLRGGVACGLLWGLAPHLVGCAPSRHWGAAGLETLTQALAQGELTAERLAQECLERLESTGRSLGAVTELNPQAVEIARQATSGLLGGIPVLVKDNIATGDRMATAAGSAALASSRAAQDAAIVTRLRQAGAVLVGKANMSEWSNLRSNNSTSGWSARGGQCRNPHDPTRSPSGSSSGSAAAVAAGLVPLALGTEMLGSISCPASACGVVGLKPTLGLLPTQGIIPAAASFDCVGPMARSVRDVAVALQALTGSTEDYLGGLQPGALRGARLGVARQDFGFDARVDRLMEEQLQVLSRLGATLVDPVPVPRLRPLFGEFIRVWTHEFKDGLNRYLAAQSPEVPVRSLAQVIAYNEANPQVEALEELGQDLLVLAEACGPLTSPAYLEALKVLREAAGPAVLGRLFEERKLQAVVAPTLGPAWTIDFVNGDHFEGSGSAPPALAGCPHLTVPGGWVSHLPVGLSFYGPQRSEARLLALAFDYERTTQHFRLASG